MHVSLRLYRSLQTVHPKPETRTNLHAPRLPLLPVRCYRLIAWASAFLLAGCAVVGPPSIRNGRSVYNDAINDTNNQQLLMAIIRGRYSENASLLAVNSITANFSVATSAGIQFGFGNESNYAGNLVPFSASAVYEENPTVSYAPEIPASANLPRALVASGAAERVRGLSGCALHRAGRPGE